MKNRLRHVRLWVTVITLLLVPLAAREAFAYRETKLESSELVGRYWEFGSSVAIDGDRLVVGAANNRFDPSADRGTTFVFEYNGAWNEVAKLVPVPPSPGQAINSGGSVALDGDWVVVSAVAEDNDTGAVYVFKDETIAWAQEARLVALDGAEGDLFGYCVSIDGSRIVVGAPYDDASTGSAHVFRFNKTTGTWVHEAKLTASDAASGDEFGRAVSIDGTHILVGAPWEGTTGSGYVFERAGTTWTQVDKLTPSRASIEGFGGTVSLEGARAVVGAITWFSDFAYVFEYDGAWNETAELTPAYYSGFNFGHCVDICGDTIAVGDPDLDVASIFVHDGANWIEKVPLVPTSCEGYFGYSVAVSDTRVLVGARGAYSPPVYEYDGSAHVFELEPIVDVRVNGENWPVVVGPGQSVRFSFSLDPGAWLGDPSDYWIFILAAGGMVPWTVQAPLVPIPETTIMNAPLAPGWYIFFFAVDDIPDGAYQQMWYDFGVAVCEP